MTYAVDFSQDFGATVAAVLLHEDPVSGELVPIEGTTAVDLDVGTPPTPELIAQLLDSSVRVSAPSDVPYEVVEAINELPIPALFARTPWLRAHRALVLHDRRVALSAFEMRYSPHLGLVVDEPQRTDTGE